MTHLTEIEERAKKATEGPWANWENDGCGITGPTTPSTSGPTVEEQLRYRDWEAGKFRGERPEILHGVVKNHPGETGATIAIVPIQPDESREKMLATIDFIAHSREDIPYLLSLLRSAEEAFTKIRNDGYDVRKHVSPSNVAAWNAIAGIQSMAESMLSKIREEGGRGK